MKNVLFVCTRNRLRSPTAETIFSNHEAVEVSSAGVNPDADTSLTAELVTWADIIFVMERSHRRKLQQRFRSALQGQRIICLDIPDHYAFMDPALITLLRARVTRHLPTGEPKATNSA